MEVMLDAYEETACPLCTASVPINIDVGKGREYIERNQNMQS